MSLSQTDLSIIIPVYNEAENIHPLHEALTGVLNNLDRSYEILYCDDGSEDGSVEILRELAASDPGVKVILLRRNFGQTASIVSGVDHARGDILVLMDADLQNDPADIPKLLEKLDGGYDIISGWRRHRRDPFFTKVLPSKIANRFISWMTGMRLHDYGCTLKAYRREIFADVTLYGEMHRFIPIFGHWAGAKVGEIEVNHSPRRRGKSKYSIRKTFRVLLDLPVLMLMGQYLTRPVHLFGAIGLSCTFGGFICAVMVAYEKITQWEEAKVHRNPLLLLAVFFALVGIQVIMIGLLAELMTRVYHESQHKKIYAVRETMNIGMDEKEENPVQRSK